MSSDANIIFSDNKQAIRINMKLQPNSMAVSVRPEINLHIAADSLFFAVDALLEYNDAFYLNKQTHASFTLSRHSHQQRRVNVSSGFDSDHRIRPKSSNQTISEHDLSGQACI